MVPLITDLTLKRCWYMVTDNFKLQFITHHNAAYSDIDSAGIALEGGCRWIQLRMKGVDDATFEEAAIAVQKMCRDYGATFIIDDNVALAQRVKADGVHLGKSDMPIYEARRILGQGYIIGATVNTFDDIVEILKSATPDYFGCGPFRYTATKSNLSPTLGCEGYSEIASKMRECGMHTPLVAIGGITRGDIAELLQCGVDGIALSSTIINAENPQCEMSQIVALIYTQNR